VGQQLWSTYISAINLVNQLKADPRGLSTDSRLRRYASGQWLAEVAQGINLLRLRNEVVKGPDRVTGFKLLNVTATAATFEACDTNSQNYYDSKTGAELPNSNPGPSLSTNLRITEIPGPSRSWLISQVALNEGDACAS
jgi:hypothetical protein